jgi:hypothetical protein
VIAAQAQETVSTTVVASSSPLTSKGRLAQGFLVVASARRESYAVHDGRDPGCEQTPNWLKTFTCAVPGKRFNACWFAPGQARSRDVFFCRFDPWTNAVARVSLPLFPTALSPTSYSHAPAQPWAVTLAGGQRCQQPTLVDTTASPELFGSRYDCGEGLRVDTPSGRAGGLWTANAYVVDGVQEYTNGTRAVSEVLMATPSALPRIAAHPVAAAKHAN